MPNQQNRNCHTVWLATGFQVEAETPREAEERAQEWLDALLERAPSPTGGCFHVAHPAMSLSHAIVLALQLMALENRGGDAAAQVARLRAEVKEQGRKLVPVPVAAG